MLTYDSVRVFAPAHYIEDFDILGITVRKEVVNNFFGYLAKYLCYDFVI